MINIDVFTLGNEFKDDSGNIYLVTSNFGEGAKIFIELEKKGRNEELENLIKET